MNKADQVVRIIISRIEDRDIITNSEIQYATRNEAAELASSPAEETTIYNEAINKLERYFNNVF